MPWSVLMENKRPKVLFVINGLGLGNSTRCYAIIQELAQKHVDVVAILCGNSRSFFKNKKEISKSYSIDQLRYGTGKEGEISFFKTIRRLPVLLRTLASNNKRICSIIESENPDAIVVDSQYIFGLNPRFKKRLFAINNARDVVRNFPGKPGAWSHKSLVHFLFIECMDFLFHRTVYKNVLSPEIPDNTWNSKKSLLVRRGLASSPPNTIENVVVMLSGSTTEIQSTGLTDWKPDFKVNFVGISGTSAENLNFVEKDSENEALLRSCDVMVINAGFSSLSESLALAKPTIVIPLKGHSEQLSNAEKFKSFGTGIVVKSYEEVPAAIEEIRKNSTVFLNKCRQLDFDSNQASSFANKIVEAHSYSE